MSPLHATHYIASSDTWNMVLAKKLRNQSKIDKIIQKDKNNLSVV